MHIFGIDIKLSPEGLFFIALTIGLAIGGAAGGFLLKGG